MSTEGASFYKGPGPCSLRKCFGFWLRKTHLLDFWVILKNLPDFCKTEEAGMDLRLTVYQSELDWGVWGDWGVCCYWLSILGTRWNARVCTITKECQHTGKHRVQNGLVSKCFSISIILAMTFNVLLSVLRISNDRSKEHRNKMTILEESCR